MAGFPHSDHLAIDRDAAFHACGDTEWKHIESRFGGALEPLGATVFILLMIFLVMAFIVSHARALFVRPH